MDRQKEIRVIITGGGTGGHVFPALAIADEIKRRSEKAEILFIGTDNRLEAKIVPQKGYDFVGLPVRGLQRKFSLKIFDTFFRLFKSIRIAKKQIRKFKPALVIGVGGYASAPVMHVANKKRIATVIQEQNSYPGITNRMLAKKVDAICVAYEGLERYFPPSKIYLTGNPVRTFDLDAIDKQEALNYFGLASDKKTIFVTGGSLGANTLNRAIASNLDVLSRADVQILWQCGANYYDDMANFLESKGNLSFVELRKFIERMDYAYKVADLVIARAGAITISELQNLGMPAIFVPSPNVAEDHQTKNAMAMVKKQAAYMVADNEAHEKLIPLALKIIADDKKLQLLSEKMKQLAKPDAVRHIVDIAFEKIIKM